MTATTYPLSTRRNVLAGSALIVLASLLPRRVFAQEGTTVSASSTPFDGKTATLENLQEFGLLGLRHRDPAAGWQRVVFSDNRVMLFSAAHPDGIDISYHDILTAAEKGMASIHPTYAGRSLDGAFDGHGLIGARLV